jgi:ubiquinone/menaquinone biosynthesis C-methylase UbiE
MNQPRNREQLSRVYSDETWRVYDALDRSLEPRGPSSLYDVAGGYLNAGSKILDAGCRDAAHLIELVRRYGATGVGIDPVEVHIERAKAAVEAAELKDRIEVSVGVMQELPFPDGHFDFVWCRDVVAQVDELEAAFRETARVLSRDGHLLVFATFRTDRLSAEETEMFSRHLGNVPANLLERNVEAAFAHAGLTIESKELIGTEWREYAEERTQPASLALLRLSRLRRQRAELIARFGADICDSVEANLHWETFQLLGKLLPTVYVLTRSA